MCLWFAWNSVSKIEPLSTIRPKNRVYTNRQRALYGENALRNYLVKFFSSWGWKQNTEKKYKTNNWEIIRYRRNTPGDGKLLNVEKYISDRQYSDWKFQKKEKNTSILAVVFGRSWTGPTFLILLTRFNVYTYKYGLRSSNFKLFFNFQT